MNSINKARKAIREQIYIKYNSLFVELQQHIEKFGSGKIHRTEIGAKIVKVFRTKLGYSPKTFDGDILSSAYMNWKRRKVSGKALYNNWKDEQ